MKREGKMNGLQKIKKPELLSPAGNFEKLKSAYLYGADAAYVGGKLFGMRAAAGNFSVGELIEAANYAHNLNKKLYLTLNTMPHADEYGPLKKFLNEIKESKIDALIVADLGVLNLVKQIMPETDIHISTQAGIVSPEAALAYANLGASRVVLARELSLSEIKEIRASLPETVEIEAFVHGSMCVSHSGRCMLSHHLTNRDANRGACTQPCRWNYKIVEEKRPDIPLPIEENELGTFIMSSKDMCTVELIPELIKAGINSFKIEGRMKSAYYTALVTNAYRIAIDDYFKNPDEYSLNPLILDELESVSHREYCTGYYSDSPFDEANLCSTTGYIREKAYFAICDDNGAIPENLVKENENGRLYAFIQKNKVSVNDKADVISPGKVGRKFTVTELYNEKGEEISSAPHAEMRFFVRIPFEVKTGDIMRSGE